MGKGTIQSAPQKLSDGSAVVITTARLLSGQQTAFDGAGLEPDLEAPLSAEEEQAYYDLTPETDSQVQRAVELANTAAGVSSSWRVTGSRLFCSRSKFTRSWAACLSMSHTVPSALSQTIYVRRTSPARRQGGSSVTGLMLCCSIGWTLEGASWGIAATKGLWETGFSGRGRSGSRYGEAAGRSSGRGPCSARSICPGGGGGGVFSASVSRAAGRSAARSAVSGFAGGGSTR